MAGRNPNGIKNGIKIGIIGPPLLVENVASTITAFPSFAPILGVYETEAEVAQLADTLQKSAEVLLFTDPISYRLAKDHVQFIVPAQHVPLTGTGLYRALFHISKQNSLSALTVDSLPQKMVEHTLKELGETAANVQYFSGNEHAAVERLASFHEKQYTSGRSKAAITGFRSVAAKLEAAGVPTQWIVPTVQDITVSLERALLSTETRKSKESQIVLGQIHIDNFAKIAGMQTSEHDVQRLRLDIHRMMLGYIETLDGHLTHLGGDDFMFVTTRGIFERETGGYKTIPLAREASKTYELSLSIGIGFGLSANEAGTHARLAMRHAQDAGGNFCFIVREDGSVIGPLEMTQPLGYDLSLVDARLLKQVESVGMSTQYLSKLIAYFTRFAKMEYSAHELASILGVTVRTTHRFLLAWLDAGLIVIAGEEKSSARGRPRQIYRLAFLEKLVR